MPSSWGIPWILPGLDPGRKLDTNSLFQSKYTIFYPPIYIKLHLSQIPCLFLTLIRWDHQQYLTLFFFLSLSLFLCLSHSSCSCLYETFESSLFQLFFFAVPCGRLKTGSPKYIQIWILWNLWMLPLEQKKIKDVRVAGFLQMWLTEGSWDGR